ncbi:hypothetical protein HDV05_000435 [Chytridiales sp. JEL 0842]|nr:hypothetical protein HDV05_000435 [Chytridiales sp. JEL 0842]
MSSNIRQNGVQGRRQNDPTLSQELPGTNEMVDYLEREFASRRSSLAYTASQYDPETPFPETPFSEAPLSGFPPSRRSSDAESNYEGDRESRGFLNSNSNIRRSTSFDILDRTRPPRLNSEYDEPLPPLPDRPNMNSQRLSQFFANQISSSASRRSSILKSSRRMSDSSLLGYSRKKGMGDEDDDLDFLKKSTQENTFRNESALSGIRGWYVASYRDTVGRPTKTARYCNGRFSLWFWIFININVIGFILTLILGPIFYFYLIPKIIQDQLNNPPNNLTGKLTVQAIDINQFLPDGFGLRAKASLPAVSIFPVRAGIGAMVASVFDEQNKIVVDANIPEVEVTINQPINLDLSPSVSFANADKPALRALINKVSMNGFGNTTLTARFNTRITLFGITVYRALPLYKELKGSDFTPTPGADRSVIPALLLLPPEQRQNNVFAEPQDLLTLPPPLPAVKITQVQTIVTDAGVELKTGFQFQNPTVVSLQNFTDLSFGISVESAKIATIKVSGVSLGPGVQTVNPVVSVTMEQTKGASDAIAKAINKAFGGEESLMLGVVGPVAFSQVTVFETFTDSLMVPLPASLFRLGGLLGNQTSGADVTDQVRKVLQNSIVNVDLNAQAITTKANLALPRFLALPANISFPYPITLGLFASGQETIQINVDPVDINTDRSKIGVRSGVTILPQNTEQAATALANAINPLLAANPQPASIDARNISVINPTTGKPFQWTQSLLGGQGAVGLSVKLSPSMFSIPAIVGQLGKVGGASAGAGTVQPMPMPGMGMPMTSGSVSMPRPSSTSVMRPASSSSASSAARPSSSSTMRLGARQAEETSPVVIPSETGTLEPSASEGVAPQSTSPASNTIALPSGTALPPTPSSTPASRTPGSSFSLSVNQLTTTPGFEISGTMSMQTTSMGMPITIAVNLGYFSILTHVQDQPIAQFVMPQGIQLADSKNPMASFSAQLLVAQQNQMLTGALQGFVNDLSGAQAAGNTSFVGATGITFGASQQAAFMTFSKINAQLSASTVMEAAKALSNFASSASSSTPMLPPNSIRVDSVGFQVNSATSVSTSLAATLSNLPQVSMNLGAFGANVIFADQNLMALQGTPLQIAPGANIPFSMQVAATLAQGNPTLNMGISQVANGVVSGKVDAAAMQTTVGLSGLQLASVDGNPANTLNAIAGVNFVVPMKTLAPFLAQGQTGAAAPRSAGLMSALDLSKVLPSAATMRQFQLKLGQANFVTAPGGALNIGAAFAYANPLAVTAVVPYFTSSVGIDQTANALAFGVSGISLNPAQGQMNTAVAVQFSQDPQVAASVGKISSDIFSGAKLTNKFALSGFTFGTSPQDASTLFSMLNLDLTPLANSMNNTGGITGLVNSVSPVKFPATLAEIQAALGGNGTSTSIGMTTGGQVTLQTVPGKAIQFQTALQMRLPFDANVELGFVNVGFGVDSQPMTGFQMPVGVQVKSANGMANVMLSAELKFADGEPTQAAVAKFANTFLAGQPFQSTVNINSFDFGASPADRIGFFSAVNLTIPMASVLKPSGPVDVTAVLLGGMGSRGGNATEMISNLAVGLTTAPKNSLQAAASAGVRLPFAANVNLGSINTQVGLNNNPMVAVSLPAGIQVAPDTTGVSNLKVGVNMQFQDNDATQTAFANMISGFLAGTSLNATANAGGFAFGASPNDMINTFSKITVPINVDSLLNAVMPRGGNGTATIPAAPTGPSSTIIARPSSSAAVNEVPSPAGSEVPSTISETATSSAVESGTITATPAPSTEAIANELRARQEGGEVAVEAAPSASETVAGPSASESGSATPSAPSQGDSASPIETPSAPTGTGTAAPAPSGSSAPAPGSAGGILTQLDPQLLNATFNTLPNQQLELSTIASFVLPFPVQVTINAGFMGAQTGVSGSKIANFALPNFQLAPMNGTRQMLQMQTRIQFVDDQTGQAAFGSLVNNFLAGKPLGATGDMSNIKFGDSAEDTLTILNKVNFKAPLDRFNPNLGPIDVGGLAALAAFNIIVNGGATVNSANLALAPQKTVNAALDINSRLFARLPAAFSIGYNSISTIAIDDAPMLSFATAGIQGAQGNVRIPGVSMLFNDDAKIQDRIASLVTAATAAPLQFPGNLVISGFSFGASPQDTIRTFSQVTIPARMNAFVPVIAFAVNRTLNAPAAPTTAPTTPNMPQIGGVSLLSAPGRTVNFAASARFINPIPASASVPFFAVSAGVDGMPVTNLGVSNLNLAMGNNDNQVSASVNFPATPGIQDKLAQFAVNLQTKFGNTTEALSLTGVTFGASPTDRVDTFSKAQLNIPSSLLGMLMPAMGQTQPATNQTRPAANTTSIANMLRVGSVTLDGSQPGAISFGANVGVVVGIPTNAQMKIGTVGFAAILDNQMISNVALPNGFQITSDAQAITAIIDTKLALGGTPELQQSIATLVQQFTTPTAPFTAVGGVTGFTFGHSPDDVVDTFSKIPINLALSPVLTPARDALNSALASAMAPRTNGTGVALPFQFALNSAAATLPAANTIGLSAQASITGIPAQINANMPYFAAKVMINGQEFIVPAGQALKFTNNTFELATTLAFQQNDQLANALFSGVGGAVLGSARTSNITTTLTGLSFGASQQSAFNLASQAALNIPVDPILNMVRNMATGVNPAALLNSADGVIKNSGVGFDVQLAAGMGMNIDTSQFGSIIAKANYLVPGNGTASIGMVDINQINLRTGAIKFNAVAGMGERGINAALNAIVPKLLNGQPGVTGDALLGGIDIKGANGGASFSVFANSYARAPEVALSAGSLPINVKLDLSNLIGNGGLNVGVDINTINPLPVSLQVGNIDVKITDKRGLAASIKNDGILALKSSKNGGNTAALAGSKFTANVPIPLNPITLLVRLGELTDPLGNFKPDFTVMSATDGNIEFLDQILNRLPEALSGLTLSTLISIARGAGAAGFQQAFTNAFGAPPESFAEYNTFMARTTVSAGPGITYPDPADVKIESLIYGGSGCPQGSAVRELDPTGTAFSLTFSNYVAALGPEFPLVESRKNCQLNLDIRHPAGWQYTLLKVEYTGYVDLSADVKGIHRTAFYFQGEAAESTTETVLQGPQTGDYDVTATFGGSNTVWSSCKADRNLNINSSIRLSGTGSGIMTTDTTQGTVVQNYSLLWRKC